jgi:hypothetical protein
VLQPVPVAEYAGVECKFEVLYRRADEPAAPETVVTVNSPFQHQLTIALQPEVDYPELNSYTVRIRMRNLEGTGPYSLPVTIQEVPLPPTKTISNLKVTTMSGNSLLVEFTGIDLAEEPTFRAYMVKFWEYTYDDYNDNQFHQYETVYLEDLNATRHQQVSVWDLTPGMNYKFRVHIINAGGIGPASEQTYGETYQGQPTEEVTGVHVMAIGDGGIRVRWNPIETLEGEAPLEGYVIWYWKYGVPDELATHYIWYRNKEGDEDVKIQDLEPGERYSVSVQPFSRGGFGPRSNPRNHLMRYTEFNLLWRNSAVKLAGPVSALLAILSPIFIQLVL